MRFLVDECTGPLVASWLRQEGHDVFSVFDSARGASDADVLQRSVEEDRILITNDKDFGERVYREGAPHRGVIFLRLADERSRVKKAVLRAFLTQYAQELNRRFVVVSENQVRFAGE